MTVRKHRVRVVLDTNVLVRFFKTASPTSPNRLVTRIWFIEKRLQLIISPEILSEYLEIFANVVMLDDAIVKKWLLRFESKRYTTMVNLGRRYDECRDPDDNLVLATALAGKAKFLITNDNDLLDLPESFQKGAFGFAAKTHAVW